MEACPACGGGVRLTVYIEETEVIVKILTQLDAKRTAPEVLIPNCTKSGLVMSPVLQSIAVSRLVLSRQLILFSAVLPDTREFLFVIEQ